MLIFVRSVLTRKRRRRVERSAAFYLFRSCHERKKRKQYMAKYTYYPVGIEEGKKTLITGARQLVDRSPEKGGDKKRDMVSSRARETNDLPAPFALLF